MTRDAGLGLVKWLAMLSMLIDHLRYLWPDAYGLFVIGRLAFPLFCLGIAANVARTRSGELFSECNARYLGWLLAFSLLSELPYRLLSPESATLNVMPILSLGLLLAWGIHHADRNSLFLAATALVVALLLHRQLSKRSINPVLADGFVFRKQRQKLASSSTAAALRSLRRSVPQAGVQGCGAARRRAPARWLSRFRSGCRSARWPWHPWACR